MPHSWRLHLAAVVAYALVAVVFSWPLPANLSSHLTGPPGGDAGVYVWNQWVFQHEIRRGSSPWTTDTIFAPSGPVDLSQHNYTPAANALALPLMGPLGVVTSFNTVFLLLTVATAYAMFLLARAVTGGANLESWLAGLLFAWSPSLVSRSMGQFSLASAVPLPLFVLLLIRVHRRQRIPDAIALGAVLALAGWTDAYYPIFCMLIAVGYGAAHVLTVERRITHGQSGVLRRALDAAIAIVLGLAAAVAATGGWQFTVAGQSISMRGLYTPMLVATVLVAVRIALRYTFSAAPAGRDPARAARLGLVALATAALLIAPMLYGLGQTVVQGQFETPPVLWRSSPPGVDAAALAIPNPNHPLAPPSWRAWLAPDGRLDSYMENVASVSWVAVAVLVAAWRRGWRLPRLWTTLTVGAAALAIGPFLHIAHIQTYVPGPWALLRYVPVIGLVRSPGRFMVIVLLGLAVLFALALCATGARPHRRRQIVATVGVLLALELLPAPRPLYSADIPAFYAIVAADPRRDIRLLELPTGVRDGRSLVGDYTARTQFFQTRHGRPVFGGLLSRVPAARIAALRQDPVMDALMALSEEGGARELPPPARQRVIEEGPAFVSRLSLGYVVIDRGRASAPLAALAVDAFALERIASDGPLELYVPRTDTRSGRPAPSPTATR